LVDETPGVHPEPAGKVAIAMLHVKPYLHVGEYLPSERIAPMGSSPATSVLTQPFCA
jgi:hypothetical protein